MQKNTEKPIKKQPLSFPSIPILIAIVISLFFIEMTIMVFLSFLPPLPELVVAVIDSILLLVISGLLFYFLWVRKFKETLSSTEQAFLDEAERVRVIGNVAQDAIIMMEDDGNISYWNPAAEKIFGFTRDEIIGKQLREYLIPPEFRKAHEDGIKIFRKKGEGSAIGKTIELTALRKNGEIFPVELSLSSMLRGGRWHAIGLVRDITRRKQVAKDHLRLVTAVEQSDETIMITDSNGIIQYVNPAFKHITGYKREEVIGKNPRFLKSSRHDNKFYLNLWSTLASGDIWKGRFINKRKDGTLYEEDATISPIKDDKGKIINFVAVKRDITKEVSLEMQLRQHQKMEAIGRLAGGIAHDFNNILTGILGYAELAKRKTDETNPLYKNMKAIIAGGNRAKALVEQILTFSRTAKDEKVNLAIDPIIKEVLHLLRNIIPKNIAIAEEVGSGEGIVYANPNKLHQVMINLCTNAIEAMPDGGTMTVSLSSFTVGKNFSETHLDCKRGEYLKVSIKDTGHGIERKVLGTLFEPFLTTKGIKNTGLGLSVVHGIVKETGGTVVVEETSEAGTTFSVFLPKSSEAEAEIPKVDFAKEGKELRGNSERIMLVDDEEMVTDVQSQILRRLGYKVTSFHNSLQALEAFKKTPNDFDLVLTDLAMPDMTGEHLSKELIKVRQDIPIIICTGYSDQLSEETFNGIGIKAYLTKPVLIPILSQTLRKALGKSME